MVKETREAQPDSSFYIGNNFDVIPYETGVEEICNIYLTFSSLNWLPETP